MNKVSNYKLAEMISLKATKSMLYEVTVNPKPGLVDPVDHKTHPDMNVFTFIDSALSLRNYFFECSLAGLEFSGANYQDLFTKIRHLGIKAETQMLEVTSGINTHKGAIFSLGIMVTATAVSFNLRQNGDCLNQILKIVKKMTVGLTECDFKATSNLSFGQLTEGQKQFRMYGYKGVRGEVEAGFPTIMKYAWPHLKSLPKSVDLNQRLLSTLFVIEMHIKDSNLIKRVGNNSKIINSFKLMIKDYLAIPLSDRNSHAKQLEKLNAYANQNNLSLGGAADLLIVTIFLVLIKNELF